MRRTVIFQLLLGVAFFGTLTVLGYLLFVLTEPGQEVDYTAYFGHEDVYASVVKVTKKLMNLVNAYTILTALGALIAISLVRRRFLLGVMAVFGIFCALAGTELMKGYLPRPTLSPPRSPVSRFLASESYPSGHTATAASIGLAFVLVSAARWRPWVATAAGFLSALYGITVVFVGAHRPADPMGAIFWSASCMSLAAAIALRLRGQTRIPDPHWLAMSLGAALCLLTALAALFCAKNLSPAFLPLFIMVAVIVITAFATTMWFGRVLSGESASRTDSLST